MNSGIWLDPNVFFCKICVLNAPIKLSKDIHMEYLYIRNIPFHWTFLLEVMSAFHVQDLKKNIFFYPKKLSSKVPFFNVLQAWNAFLIHENYTC